MACDPSSLIESSKCILGCLTYGQMNAVSSRLLCDIANTTGNFVLKSGDTMSGPLLVTNTNSIQSGLAISADITAIVVSPIASFFGSSNFNEILCRYSNDSSGPTIAMFKTRRTTDATADTIVSNGDRICSIFAGGADGVKYIEAVQLEFRVDGVPGLNDMPGRIAFLTVPDGSTVMGTRWIIDNTGLCTGAHSINANNATAIPSGGTSSVGYMFSSTANFGVFFGSGVPTLSAAQGSWYLRSDGGSTTTRAYINTTGAAVWTAITTVA